MIISPIKNSWRKKIFMLTFVVMIVLFCILSRQHVLYLLNSTVLMINQHAALLFFMRWTIILIIFIAWPNIIEMIDRRRKISSEKMIYWKNERTKIVLWLILFELLISENIIIKLFQLI